MARVGNVCEDRNIKCACVPISAYAGEDKTVAAPT